MNQRPRVSVDEGFDEGEERLDAVDANRCHDRHPVVLATEVAIPAESREPQIMSSQEALHRISDGLFLAPIA